MVERTGLSDIDVVILAGGLGTRIQPVLGDVPKLLAPINERTYLDYLLDWLEGFGVRRVIFSLGHQADAIVAYLAAHPRRDLSVETVIEASPQGTAGALRLVRPHIKSDVAVVMNGDTWIAADLPRFVSAHRTSGAAVSILSVTVDEAGRYGRIDVDEDGHILAFHEKQPDAGAGRINAGVYAFSKQAWESLASSEGTSLERDYFQTRPRSTLASHDAGKVAFIDIGTPESLRHAARIIGGNTSNEADS